MIMMDSKNTFARLKIFSRCLAWRCYMKELYICTSVSRKKNTIVISMICKKSNDILNNLRAYF